MTAADDGQTFDLATRVVTTLTDRHFTIAVAESLTGGLLVAELIRVPGASAVVSGGVVAYNTEVKHSLLDVDPSLLAAHGPVHPDVAMQMAMNVRNRLAVGGVPAHIGISTTGVAGPDPQGGHQPGLVFLGFAIGSTVRARELHLSGTREQIREATVVESLTQLIHLLDSE